MAKLKLSPWHKGSDRPVRNGVYERNYGTYKKPDYYYCKYNNGQWHFGRISIEEAACENYNGLANLPWRGILK